MPSLESSFKIAALAVVWTGFISTALALVIQATALGKVPIAEASVILATEPLWASLFDKLWLEEFDVNDYIGGALIVGACLVSSLTKENIQTCGDCFCCRSEEDDSCDRGLTDTLLTSETRDLESARTVT